MNNAKMWLVVSPTIGVPLFLGAVAVGSFAVHLQVVKNTSWVADFIQGVPMGTGDKSAAATIIDESKLKAAQASYTIDNGDTMQVTIILPDGSTAQAVLSKPEMQVSQRAGQLPTVISQ